MPSPWENAAACSAVTTEPGPARPSTADGPRGRWRRWWLRAHRGALGPAIGSRRGAGLHAPRRPPLHGGSPVPHLPADLKTRRPGPFPLPATQRRQRHLQHPRHVLLGQHGPRRRPSSRSSRCTPILQRPADRLIAEPAAETRTLVCRPSPTHMLAPALGGNPRAVVAQRRPDQRKQPVISRRQHDPNHGLCVKVATMTTWKQLGLAQGHATRHPTSWAIGQGTAGGLGG